MLAKGPIASASILRPMEKYLWHVRVRSHSGDKAVAYTRRHHFEIGAPVQFDQEYDAVTALEYVLGAIGADVVNGLRALALKRRIIIDDVEAAVSGELNNPLVHLGVVGEAGHPGIETVTVRVYVNSPAERKDVLGLWEEMLSRSPLVRTFSGTIKVEIGFELTA